MKSVGCLVLLLAFATVPVGLVDASSCVLLDSHTYVLQGAVEAYHPISHSYVGVGGAVVFDLNGVECDVNDDDIPDGDGDLEFGIGGGFFPVETVAECGTTGHHGETFAVVDTYLPDDVWGVAGADGNAFDDGGNPICGDGIVSSSDPDDCLGFWYGTGPHVACGVGADGGYWVFLYEGASGSIHAAGTSSLAAAGKFGSQFTGSEGCEDLN